MHLRRAPASSLGEPHTKSYAGQCGRTTAHDLPGRRNHDPRIEGIPLGLLEDRAYDEIVFQAQPNDLILLYSDGVEDQLGDGDKDSAATDWFVE